MPAVRLKYRNFLLKLFYFGPCIKRVRHIREIIWMRNVWEPDITQKSQGYKAFKFVSSTVKELIK